MIAMVSPLESVLLDPVVEHILHAHRYRKALELGVRQVVAQPSAATTDVFISYVRQMISRMKFLDILNHGTSVYAPGAVAEITGNYQRLLAFSKAVADEVVRRVQEQIYSPCTTTKGAPAMPRDTDAIIDAIVDYFRARWPVTMKDMVAYERGNPSRRKSRFSTQLRDIVRNPRVVGRVSKRSQIDRAVVQAFVEDDECIKALVNRLTQTF
jgi:hypothetical protein